MNRSARQEIIGLILIFGSMAAFFVWGSATKVFGTTIQPDIPHLGFFGWIILAFFGVGYFWGGLRGGLRSALGLAVLLGIAYGVGVLRGAHN